MQKTIDDNVSDEEEEKQLFDRHRRNGVLLNEIEIIRKKNWIIIILFQTLWDHYGCFWN